MSARNRLVLSILAVLSVFFVGTAGYMMLERSADGERLSFLDAAFMTVITLSTVGYREVWTLSPAGKVWTITIITFGIITVSYALTSLVTLFVSGEMRSVRERRKMEKTMDKLTDHVVLCGYGRMGALVVADLIERDVPVVVIEIDPENRPELRDKTITFVTGDATEESSLLRAGVGRAKALVTALPTDADNVFVTLTARTLFPELTIIARSEQPSTEAKLKRAGASRVVCPQIIGATKIANILTRPSVVDFFEIADRGVDLELDEYVLSEQSPLVGSSIRNAHVQHNTGAIVVAVKKANGQALVGPDPDAVLEAADTLILVGPAGVSTRLNELV